MSLEELLKKPLWKAEDLGKPIPASSHAVSVCMPTWQDVIDYEEGAERIKQALPSGYPRFVLHPKVKELFELGRKNFASPEEDCFAFPSRKVAERALKYLQKNGVQGLQVQPAANFGVHFLIFPKEAFGWAKEYWQHTGEIVSSRLAEAALNGSKIQAEAEKKIVIKERIAEYAEERAENVYLFPTGMAAIFMAYRLVSRLKPGLKNIQFGFPYVDTLKIAERFGPGAFLFANAEEDFSRIKKQLSQEKISAIFGELPGNPLLQSFNLKELSNWARMRAIPLVIDDTIGTFANLRVMPPADILVTSLTKFFSGEGEVTGGSLILSRESPFYAEFKQLIQEEFEDLLFDPDAKLIEAHSRDFFKRMQQINRNAEALCDFLKAHPKVSEVYYPKFQTPENYQAIQKPGAGFGGLFSLLLKDAQSKSQLFYDNLRVCKGPSLGTNYTLACPYTLLAHYSELPWVQECGVSPYLVRVSVGLEQPDDLIERFREALELI